MSLPEDGIIPLDKRRLVTGLKIPDVHKAMLRSAKTDSPISSGTRLRDGSQYSSLSVFASSSSLKDGTVHHVRGAECA